MRRLSLLLFILPIMLFTGCDTSGYFSIGKSVVDTGEQAVSGGVDAAKDMIDTLPLPDSMKPKSNKRKELDESTKAYIQEIQGYIASTDALTNYTADTTVRSLVTMSSESYSCGRTVHINSKHKSFGGTPQIRQITDEFNYIDDELVSKASWASCKSGNVIGAEYLGTALKWSIGLEAAEKDTKETIEDTTESTTSTAESIGTRGADIKYGSLAYKTLDITEDTVTQINKIPGTNTVRYEVTFNDDILPFNIPPVGLDNHIPDMPSEAKLGLVINTRQGVITESIFSLTTASKDMVRTPDGRLHYYEEDNAEYTGLARVSAMCEESTHTVYSSIDSTDFILPNLASYSNGSEAQFLNLLRGD